MVAVSRLALIQLEVLNVPAQKDMNYKWTTPHVEVWIKILPSNGKYSCM
jgi:hypothetical protein